VTYPANVDAERSILGSVLTVDSHYDEVAAIGLRDEEFSLDAHRRIFRAMSSLAESASAIDLVTLINWLEHHHELEPIGGISYVTSLMVGLPDRPSVKQYVRIVKEKAAQRWIMSACNSASAIAEEDGSKDAAEYLNDQLLQIQTGSDENPARRVLEFSDATYSEWLKASEQSSDLIGLTTGVDGLDTATTGIRRKEIWVYAADTGEGKTNLALQTLSGNCRKEIPVGMFSIEMGKEELLGRLWSSESRVDYKHIRFPKRLSSEVKAKIERAMIDVAKWPLFIVEDRGIPLSKLLAKSRLLIRREKVELLVVDYIQLIKAPGKDERQQLTTICHSLAALAGETGVPIIELSQLSRPTDGQKNRRPTKFRLKESGAIEQDANVIVMIYRPVDDRGAKTHEDELIVDKQRGGLSSIEPVCFMNWLRFEERETR
jgi:replicative DNA helicase